MEEYEKIFEAICKFYKFHVISYNFRVISSGIFLKTARNNLLVGVSRDCNQHDLAILSFSSHYNIVEAILKWANVFEIHEDGKKVVYIKNIFLGCKTLEDVLIMKDLHSNKEITR